jgi:hypothetical protein
MRFQIALIGIVASAIPAMAQSEHCKSITVPKERLACYDKTAEPTPRSSMPTSTSPTPVEHQSTASEFLQKENERLDNRMKSICRGC